VANLWADEGPWSGWSGRFARPGRQLAGRLFHRQNRWDLKREGRAPRASQSLPRTCRCSTDLRGTIPVRLLFPLRSHPTCPAVALAKADGRGEGQGEVRVPPQSPPNEPLAFKALSVILSPLVQSHKITDCEPQFNSTSTEETVGYTTKAECARPRAQQRDRANKPWKTWLRPRSPGLLRPRTGALLCRLSCGLGSVWH